MRVLDLCCGLGGWTGPWREAGHFVVGVDIEAPADVIADVRRLPLAAERWDVILASPPCDEFSRESMPWHRTGKAPDLSIVRACVAFAKTARPRVFILENVRGAQRWLGKARCHYGSRYLWGWFPDLGQIEHSACYGKSVQGLSAGRKRRRALIPEALAQRVMEVCLGK